MLAEMGGMSMLRTCSARAAQFIGILQATLARWLTRTNNSHVTEPEQQKSAKTPYMLIASLGVVAIIVVGIVIVLALQKPAAKHNVVGLLSGQASVTRVGDSGFGKLTAATGATATTNLAAPTAPGDTTGRAMNADSAISGSGGGTSIAMPYPVQYGQSFVYKGDTFTQDQAKLDVYKRVPIAVPADQAATLLQQLNLRLVDLGSFGSSSLDTLQFSQQQDFGYTIALDLKNGSIMINQNVATWPQTAPLQPTTLAAMPSDEAIIAVADAFLKDHAILRDAYGAPVVQNQWRKYMEATNAGGQQALNMQLIGQYVPDAVAVVYPQLLNGKPVYEQSGTPSGLTLMVSLRYNKVSSVYGLNTQDYQASAYDAITEVPKIIQYAEQGGQYGFINYGGMMTGAPEAVSAGSVTSSISTAPPVTPNYIIKPPSTLPESDLGTPQMAYVKMYDYQSGASQELYAPALAFPITNASPNDYRSVVVVPLIWDLLRGPYAVPMMGVTGGGKGVMAPTPATAPGK